MIDELTYAKEMLKRGGYTLVICSSGKVQVSGERGIKPLLQIAESGEDWNGAYAADKIVGKAAAMLYVLLGVKAVFAEVLSESAKEVFEQNKIEYAFEALTEKIINRQGTGLCPMEQAVADVENPADAIRAINEKISELNVQKQ